MKQLFKKDSKGKIRIWKVESIDNKLIQYSGLENGKLVIHTKLCKGKNIGKSNETKPNQQSFLEAQSLIESKLTEGYFETKELAENELVILPMLASDYKLHSKKIDWNSCFIQPKLDGMRCLAICDGKGSVILKSRDGKIIENMDHIKNELSQIRENVILDGELYLHGSSFQENMKLIKKYRKGETEKIKYHIYDIVNELNFSQRSDLINILIPQSLYLDQVGTHLLENDLQLKNFHERFLELGYEGSIIRHGSKGYELDKRSTSLLKYKDFIDIDAEIIDILPNDSNPLHGTPLLKYSNQKMSGKSESIFKAGVKMSHEDREDLLKNKNNYIGKLANIRFFEWTDDGNPRFPVMVGIHEDR